MPETMMLNVPVPAKDAAEWRRWLVVGAATIGIMTGFLVMSTIGNVMKPLEDEFGWLRADIAFAYTLLSAGAALGGVVCGLAADRMDTRPIVMFGAAAMGLGLLMLARQTDLAVMQTIYLAIGTFGFACLYSPLLTTVGLWFEQRRGLVIGIVTAGGTLGQGLSPVIMQTLIAGFGWRGAYIALGLACIALLVPVLALVCKPPAAVGATPSPRARPGDASPASPQWPLPPWLGIGMLGFAAIFCCTSMAVPIVHLVTLGADRGLPPGTSAGIVFTAMLAGTVGRVSFGAIADRIGALKSYTLASAMQTATVYWFVELQSPPALYALAVVFGFGFSGVMTTLLLCIRLAAPARMAGLATALVGLMAWAGMGLGGYQGGYCYDLTGSYALSFANAAYAGLANLAVIGALALILRRAVPGREPALAAIAAARA